MTFNYQLAFLSQVLSLLLLLCVERAMIKMTFIVKKKRDINHSEAVMVLNVYLYSALPPIVAKLEKTLKSVMLSGQDWMFRKPGNGHRHIYIYIYYMHRVTLYFTQ